MPPKIKLHNYQNGAVDKTRADLNDHIQRKKRPATMVVMATGTGKTEVGLGVLQIEYDDGLVENALWLAHRKELVLEPAARAELSWNFPRWGVVMGQRNELHQRFLTGSIASLYSEKRLDTLLSKKRLTHMVYDECHHADAEKNTEVILRIYDKYPDIKLVGLTATPKQKHSLNKIFNSVSENINIRDAIRMGALVPFTAFAAELPISFANMRTSRNTDGEVDYNQKQAGDLLKLANVEEIIIKTWRENAADRPTIAFCSSVEQSKSLAAAFRAAGVTAAHVDGGTENDERTEIVKQYRAGKIQVLVNCSVYTEGFDASLTSCVLICRPTQSSVTYLQMLGRGLRLFEGKTDCLVIDFKPQEARDLISAIDLLSGKRKKPKQEAQAEKQALKDGIILDVFGVVGDEEDDVYGDVSQVKLRVLNYFSETHLAWTFSGNVASSSIGNGITLAIVFPQKSRAATGRELLETGKLIEPRHIEAIARFECFQLFSINGYVSLIDYAADWESITGKAEEFALTWGKQSVLHRSNKWRNFHPSAEQKAKAHQLGVWKPGMKMGQVSQAIAHAIALNALTENGILK